MSRALKESKVSKLASLDLDGYLSDKKIGPAGAKELAEYISVSGSLTSLNLEDNQISDEGAKAIGESLCLNGSLTKLDVHGNDIGPEGEKALRGAVKGREGFVLVVGEGSVPL